MGRYTELVGAESRRLNKLDKLAGDKPWVFITEDIDGNKFTFESGGPGISDADDSEDFLVRAVSRLLQLRPVGD